VPTPDYIAAIRRAYGQGRLLLPGVSVVVLRGDLEPDRVHLLLTRRSDTGRWSLPAGIVEPFEQPATAALRELLEETRITAEVERLALLTTDPDVVYPNGDTCQFVSMSATRNRPRSRGSVPTSYRTTSVTSNDAAFSAHCKIETTAFSTSSFGIAARDS
jgi:8-oxo-dGTP pyrophosphatase MutT (NUDIX family)